MPGNVHGMRVGINFKFSSAWKALISHHPGVTIGIVQVSSLKTNPSSVFVLIGLVNIDFLKVSNPVYLPKRVHMEESAFFIILLKIYTFPVPQKLAFSRQGI